MAHSAADLLTLQANIKIDKDGYKNEFAMQYQHYKAALEIFNLRPMKEHKEFGDLVMFIAQVGKQYPHEVEGFPGEVIGLLERQAALLEPALRVQLVQALILLRNRGQLEPGVLLPVLFQLFRCQDKPLRELLFRHIVQDIKGSNEKHRSEKLNRRLQSFLYSMLQDDSEAAAKKSLAVLTSLWRKGVWRDARTVNVIASATQHKSGRVVLAALKFFLRQDQAQADSDDEQEPAPERREVAAPTKEDIYKAYKAGTRSSKKKKQAKIKRVLATLKRQTRRFGQVTSETFAALHLLHDPQALAEKLFARLQCGGERWETRLALMALISRVIGVHKLLLLNFYPFLQKYIAPHQREVTQVLAALVQASHDLVPPEALQPVLRQLLDHFVSDRSRPEVMVVGIKSVCEMCMRQPLVMSRELLEDLAAYRKYRDKEVSSAARGLIHLFQEVDPSLLPKKERGRGADMEAHSAEYGAQQVRMRVEGAVLLEEALQNDEERSGGSMGNSDLESVEGDEDEEGGWSDGAEHQAAAEWEGSKEADGSEEEEEEEEDEEEGNSDEQHGDSKGSEEWEWPDAGEEEQATRLQAAGEASSSRSGGDSDHQEGDTRGKRAAGKPLVPTLDSLSNLKKQLAKARTRKQQQQEQEQAAAEAFAAEAGSGTGAAGGQQVGVGGDATPRLPIEMDRILTDEDFERIRVLKQQKLVDAAMAKHGLKSAAKIRKAEEAAQAEAEATLELAERRAYVWERRMDPDALTGRHKRRRDKEERLQSVVAGREGRTFGAAAALKKHKTGGLSEREKQKRKQLPLAARLHQLQGRAQRSRMRKAPKNFKGHVHG